MALWKFWNVFWAVIGGNILPNYQTGYAVIFPIACMRQGT